MKKHLTYVATYGFFVVTQLRVELKRVCHDTMNGRLKKKCRDIENIVVTQADQSSFRVFCNISKLCRDNYHMVLAEVWCDIQTLSHATQKREQGKKVCHDNKYICRNNHLREMSFMKAMIKS